MQCCGLERWHFADTRPGMATAYAAGIVRNHRFVDGNKHTGFVVSTAFLELNGTNSGQRTPIRPARS
jgi:hypothetical protein